MNKLFEYVTNLKNPKLICVGQNYPTENFELETQDQNNREMNEDKYLADQKKQIDVQEETTRNNANIVPEEQKMCDEQNKNEEKIFENQISKEKQISEEKQITEEKQISEEKFISEEKQICKENIIIEEKFVSEEKFICEEKEISEHKQIQIQEQEEELLCIYYKPISSCVQNFDDEIYVKLPESGHLLDFGIELGFMIDKEGKNIPLNKANEFVSGYFIAFSFQDRKLQTICNKKQLPWTLAIGQDNFTPISQIVEERLINYPYQITISVKLNDNLIWKFQPKNMIHKIDKLINYLSHYQTLQPGDLILTGSPKLFGPIKKKDRLFGSLESEGETLATIDVIIK